MRQTTKDLASKIYKLLSDKFGNAKCELDFKNNFQLLVAVILSARCTDKRVNLITKNLFKKYKNAFELANADLNELEKEIFSCGFYKNKAKNLIEMAKDVLKNYGGKVPSNFNDLVKLAGVGRKTANVVLSVAFSQPAIAVDTHVFRVSNRLGLVEAKTPIECEKGLQKILEKDKWSQFHHFLVLFGRYFCKSQKPLCKDCELKNYCKFVKKSDKFINP